MTDDEMRALLERAEARWDANRGREADKAVEEARWAAEVRRVRAAVGR